MSRKLFSNSTAKRNGRVDGAKNIPRPGAKTPPPFVNRVSDKANQVIRTNHGDWQKADAKLKSQQQEVQSRYDQASLNYEQCKRVCGRDARFVKTPRWYVPLIILLGIAELYMNKEGFSRFFQSQGLANHEIWIMALILSFSLPGAGHFLGRFLRERPWNPWNRTLLVWAVITTIASGATIVFISWLRANIMQAGNGDAGGTMVWMFFLSLNLLVFLVAIVAAFYCHEEYPELLKYKQVLQASERRLRRLEGKRNALKAASENKAKAVAHRAYELIDIYHQANIRKREDGNLEVFPIMLLDIEMPPFTPVEFAELNPSTPITMNASLTEEISEISPSNDGHASQSKT